MTTGTSTPQPSVLDGSSPLPLRKSRLRRTAGRPLSASASSNATGNTTTHTLPKQWLILWGAGLVCLASVSLLPIVVLEYSTSEKGTVQSRNQNSHGVHRLMDPVAAAASRLLPQPKKNTVNSATGTVRGNGGERSPSVVSVPQQISQPEQRRDGSIHQPQNVVERQIKPHYTLSDLPHDTVNWQNKPLARGVSGRPMTDTPALQGAQRAHIDCDIPVDALAYWNDPVGTRDLHYESPFTGVSATTPSKTRYITFTPDRGYVQHW
jgi:hypothetical protein